MANVTGQLGTVLKALVAGLVAGLSALSAYLVNDTSLGQMTAGQYVQVALAALVAFGAVFAVPNKSGGA